MQAKDSARASSNGVRLLPIRHAKRSMPVGDCKHVAEMHDHVAGMVNTPVLDMHCRIAAGGDARSRQSRLGSDVRDTFPENDDEDDDDDDKDGKKAFAKFDEPTRIEGEGGGVDPDPGDRDSVSHVTTSRPCA